MIDNFLRPPRGTGEVAADALRVCGVLSVVLALFLFQLTDAGILAFTLPGLIGPRFIGLKPGADIMISVVLLIAAWSNVFELYTMIAWWDLVVHFFCGGVLAMGGYLFLARLEIVPTPFTKRFTPAAGLVLTTVLGLALGSLWEMVEWLGYTYITPDIHVTYQDTIGDMVAGGLGALCLGFAVAYRPLLCDTPATAIGRAALPERPPQFPTRSSGAGGRDFNSTAPLKFGPGPGRPD